MGYGEQSHKDSTLVETVLRLSGDFRNALRPLGLTLLQAAILLHVSRNSHCWVSSLANALSLKPPTLTPHIAGAGPQKTYKASERFRRPESKAYRSDSKGTDFGVSYRGTAGTLR